MIQLHCGDCIDVLKTLPSDSVSAIVTDPPYGQTNEKYESPIAFNPELWRECFRVAKPNAALISFAGSPTYHKIASAIEAGGWKVRQMWGWVYRDGLITSAWPKEGFDRLAPAFDPICYATKGKVLLRVERSGPAWDRLTGRKEPFKPAQISTRSNAKYRAKAEGSYPRSLVSDGSEPFEYFVMSRTRGGFGWHGEATGHPNQKPLAVMRWLVGKLPAGGKILDPFMGSATTGEAAVVEGFDFLGIERDPAYFKIAERRLKSVAAPVPA